MDNKVKRAFKVLEIARGMAEKFDKEHGTYECSGRMDEIQLHVSGLAKSAYAEPGYSGDLAATGNWNEIDTYDRIKHERVKLSNLPGRVREILEKLGFECEWSDEWTECVHCMRIVRTSPDSYSWKRSYHYDDGDGPVCHECLLEDPEEYLRSLEDNPDVAVTFDVDPCDHGYNFTGNEYETGWHPGQNDDPKKIAKELRDKGVSRFIFKIDASGQFDTRWSVYVHDDEFALLSESPEESDDSEDESDDSDSDSAQL